MDMPSPALGVFTGLKLAMYGSRIVGNTTSHTCLLFNPPLAMTSHTCLLFNPPLAMMDAYHTEFSRPGDQPEITGPFVNFEDKEQKTILTVQQLTGHNPQDFMTKSLFCKGQILKFGCTGWWYRCCPEKDCYKQCFEKESYDDKFWCNTHELRTPVPSFRISMILHDEFSDVTITLMGNVAGQFLGYKLEVLRNRLVYVTDQALPPEIETTAGQVHIFEVKGNLHGNWIVVSFSPAEEGPTVTLHAGEPYAKTAPATSTTVPALTLLTPEKSNTAHKKRGGSTIDRIIIDSVVDKKLRREEEEDEASSSPNIAAKEKAD